MTTVDLLRLAPLRRWASSCDSATTVAELFVESASSNQLADALAATMARVRGCRMLIVRFGAVDDASLLTAWATAQQAKLPVRICFAVDRSMLTAIGSKVPSHEHVGLLLDDVDDMTPPIDVVNEAIEAIRFAPRFVAKASRHLRSECVLDALLGLARNAGLATLGPASRTSRASWLDPQIDFDYVVEESA
jgi:hypothetical protein